MNNLSIAGPAGEVRWGYHPAASLASWSIAYDDTGGGRLTAAVASHDVFRASQQPLTFVVPRPTGSAWRWPILTLQIAGATLSASLGPQE